MPRSTLDPNRILQEAYDESARALRITGDFQPLDSDLTAIAALSTTTYGRSLLTLANQAALEALLSGAYVGIAEDALWHGSNATSVEMYDRRDAWSDGNNTSGTGFFTYFTPKKNLTISKLQMVSGGTASSGLTLARMALYTAAANGDLTIVARTASDTTLFGSTGTAYERSLSTTGGYPATYDLVKGTFYAVGELQVGIIAATLVQAAMLNSVIAGLAPLMAASKSGLTDLDANVASVTASNRPNWARLSA